MIVDRLFALDAALTARSFPALSPWWRETLERFLRSGRRQLVLRVGRRGGKSTSLVRALVCLALYGEHVVPAGDLGVVAIVSVSKDEAAQRLRLVRAILDAIGVGYKPIAEGIELLDRPIAFKVYTASIGGVSGFTCIGAMADECAKWRDSESGANPAAEVLASLRPTMATMPNSRLFLSSSPMSILDAHHEAFSRGDDDYQIVAHAPTWIANRTITEEDTRKLERDGRRWEREYAAIPQAAVSAAFDKDAIERAFRPRESLTCITRGPQSLIIDASSGGKDAFTWTRVYWAHDERGRYLMRGDGIERLTWPDGSPRENPDWKPTQPPVLCFEGVEGLEGSFWGQVSGDQIVDRLVLIAKRNGIRDVHSDQREAMMLESAFKKRGLRFFRHDYTQPSKVEAVEQVRRWLADGIVCLPLHEKLKKELQSFEERFTPSGALTFAGRRGGHDDYVSLLLTAAMAEAAGGLPRSPYQRNVPSRGMGQTQIMPYT